MVAPRQRPPSRMTLAEFLAWDPADPSVRHWQLIDGEPVAMAPTSDAHGSIQGEIARLLGNSLLTLGRPCRVVPEGGVVPRVRHDRNYRVPDLVVTGAPPSGAMMVPDPILIVEILSPSNEVETWANVWTCTTIPTVTEILIVSSTKTGAELLRRNPDGSWPEEPERLGPESALRLKSIAFEVALPALYRTTALAQG